MAHMPNNCGYRNTVYGKYVHMYCEANWFVIHTIHSTPYTSHIFGNQKEHTRKTCILFMDNNNMVITTIITIICCINEKTLVPLIVSERKARRIIKKPTY